MAPLRCATALLAFGLAEISIPAPATAQDFSALVDNILRQQVEGPISVMGEAKKAAMIACVNAVLKALPKGRKRFITQGEDFDERERRFGKVLYDNRAEWVQKIAGGCASIALKSEESFE